MRVCVYVYLDDIFQLLRFMTSFNVSFFLVLPLYFVSRASHFISIRFVSFLSFFLYYAIYLAAFVVCLELFRILSINVYVFCVVVLFFKCKLNLIEFTCVCLFVFFCHILKDKIYKSLFFSVENSIRLDSVLMSRRSINTYV